MTRGDRPGRHVPAVRDHSASADDESSHGSASELPPATLHGYAEWDFSGVPDPVMFQQFLDATDYWFGYLNHISWKGVLINLHRLFSFCRSFKFKPPLLNS
jgi:hypothetical protein